MAICTLEEVKTYLGITWSSEDALLNSLLSATEGTILSILKVSTLAEEQVTEKHEYKCQPYYLRGINPHGTPKINTVSLTNFEIDGYMLRFTDIVDPNDWGKISIEYIDGFATMPEDIKLAQKQMILEERAVSKAKWVTEFRQGDLTVKYGTARTENTMDIERLLSKYKRVFVCS